MARLRIELKDAGARFAIRRLVDRVEDPRPALDEIGGALVASVLDRFERSRGPDGAPWKPSRRAQKTGGKTLIDRGLLRASITHAVRVTGAQAELEVGTNVEYAAIHQFGGTVRRKARTQTLAFDAAGRFLRRSRARRRRAGFIPIAIASIGAGETEIPARPYLGVSDDDARIMRRIIGRYLTRAA